MDNNNETSRNTTGSDEPVDGQDNRDRGPARETSGNGDGNDGKRERRFIFGNRGNRGIDNDTPGATADLHNSEQKETANEKDQPVQEGITLSVSPIAPKGKRGRKPGVKLAANAAKTAGESAAKKLCDFVSFGAAWATHDIDAQMSKEERLGIEPPLSRILAKLDIVSQLDTGSDVMALLTASGFYMYRVYANYQVKKFLATQEASKVQQNGVHDAPVVAPQEVPEYQEQFAGLNEY